MKFFKYDDRIEDENEVINRSSFVNYDKITCVQILDKVPYFTVYFSNENFIEIDKIHLEKFLEGIK